MIDNKKLISQVIACSVISFGLIISLFLVNININPVAQTNLTDNAVNTKKITKNNLDFTIRSNPTNGFNGLTTPDGKYTYVLITKNSAITPDTVGGTNSGIACINNRNGDIIGQPWYLPDSDEFKNNYTTNIVFGQKEVNGKIIFDQSKIFVLCGISNLAHAINQVYVEYFSVVEPVLGVLKQGKQKIKFTTNLDPINTPSIKIFKLNLGLDGTITQGKDFYTFAYPSDGNNGYAGFNTNGVPYATQMFYASQGNFLNARAGNLDTDLDQTLYYARSIRFDGIKRNGPCWTNGKTFQEIAGRWISDSANTICAFGSYLTYLTYGQNFAYHLNNTYHNSGDEVLHHDEFLMSTSFVNVDQNIGGLYSGLVSHPSEVSDGNRNGMVSHASKQSNWPIPFGYQWLLADIADANKQQALEERITSGSQKGKWQYSYVDANGKKIQVNWGDPCALSAPIINFLNDKIFPLRNNVSIHSRSYIFKQEDLGNLYESLKVGSWFGSNWGLTTGYIIFTPSTLSTQVSQFNPNKNEYRYYYIGAIAKRSFDDTYSSILFNNSSNYCFTNLLATDQLAPDTSISYLLGITYIAGDSSMLTKNANNPLANEIIVEPTWTLGTNTYTTMFCYDWNSIANDNGENALVIPITNKLTNARFGYINNYRYQQTTTKVDLIKSFSNWNMAFLGGPSHFNINQMDTSLTIDPTWGDVSNSIVWQLANKITEVNSFNLGCRLTYLRRKISFVIFPYRGFVYFTAGTSLTWQNGLSLWHVRALGTNQNLRHEYGNDEKFVGNIFLSIKSSSTPMWSECEAAVWDIKVINQPIDNPGETLVFITTKGIYSVGGGNVQDYPGSVNHVLATCGTSSSENYKSANEHLLSVIQFMPFINSEKETDFTSTLPNALVLHSNMLWVLTNPPTAYSVQLGDDYLLSNVIGENLPHSLSKIPVAKPLLILDQASIIHTDEIKPISPGNKNIRDLLFMSPNQLFHEFLQLPLSLHAWTIDLNYKNTPLVTTANQDNTHAKIVIPVAYNNNNLTYLAPIEDADGNISNSYLLTGLQPSNYARPLVVLKPIHSINQVLQQDEWTTEKLVNMYGGDAFNAENEAKVEAIFVDCEITNAYLKKHASYFTDTYKYWLKPIMATNGGIGLKLSYSGIDGLDPNQNQWCNTNTGIVQHESYNDGLPSQINNGDGTFTINGYVPSEESSGRNIWLIVGICVAAIILASVALGLGIGIPMRKQHKINVLNAKITNKRIDKLSTAVAGSFKKVIETNTVISKNVEQLTNNVNHPLANNKTSIVPPPIKPIKPPKAPKTDNKQ